MNLRTRIAIEKQIFECVVDTLLRADFTLRLHDGEEFATDFTTDKGKILAASQSTDEDLLLVYDGRGVTGRAVGRVLFVYGNDGFDVISDYTINLESYLTPATDLADKLEALYG